ncbi:MAG: hypothetical protein KBI20_07870 [Sedimentibacter sp.]|nr:hypothetical protein [Sedimentibacter sp.]
MRNIVIDNPDEFIYLRAKKGFNNIECEYSGRIYTFYEDKPTKAPKYMLRHRFLEEVKEQKEHNIEKAIVEKIIETEDEEKNKIKFKKKE